MNGIQTACFSLIASAFLLSAILIVGIDQKSADNKAQADQVISQPQFTLMTARTGGQANDPDESLFVLDNTSGVLVVYKPNVGAKRLDPVAAIRMTNIFGGGGGGR